jgi:hypothetical protein
MKNINEKGRIVQLLNKLGEDLSNLTVGEMKDLFSKQFDDQQEYLKKIDNKIINDFDKKFLVTTREDSYYGLVKEVLKVESIKFESYDTEWVRVYSLECHVLLFSNNGEVKLFENTLSKSHNQLKQYRIIDENEYLSYVSKYNYIVSEINKIL